MKTLPSRLILLISLTALTPVCGFQTDNQSPPSADAPDPDFSPDGPYTGPLHCRILCGTRPADANASGTSDSSAQND